MTKHFNRTTELKLRRQLRSDQTYAEKLVWRYLRNRQTLKQKFKRQYSVDKYVIDFYCSKLKLAIEIDGKIHELPGHKESDEKRQQVMEKKYNIKFLRIKNEELFGNPNKTFERIEEFIKFIMTSPG